MKLKRMGLAVAASVAALTVMGGAASAASSPTTATSAFAQAAGASTATNANTVRAENYPSVISQVLWQVVAIQVVDAVNGCHTKGNMCFASQEKPSVTALD